MKVIVSEENLLKFDNGLTIAGQHGASCCEYNYLDFEQLPVGTELPDLNAREFYNYISIKQDGFIVKDSNAVPKWVQARTTNNGYYSDEVNLIIDDGEDKIVPKKSGQSDYEEFFVGIPVEYK